MTDLYKSINNVNVKMTPQEKYDWDSKQIRQVSEDEVTNERNRRLKLPFLFGLKLYDCDDDSLMRITGASTLAGFAVMNGKIAGDYKWNSNIDFVWIAHDNTAVAMDAQTCFQFGQAAVANQSKIIFAARRLKDMTPIPSDYATNETYWT